MSGNSDGLNYFKLICSAKDTVNCQTIFIHLSNIHTKRSDTDTFGEDVVCHFPVYMKILFVNGPLAGHVCDCPFVVFKELNELRLVFK